MKNPKSKTQFLILVCGLFLFSCEISSLVDPAKTEFYVISATINGSRWIPGAEGNAKPNGAISGGSVRKTGSYFYGSRLDVPFLNPGGAIQEDLYVGLPDITKTGTYPVLSDGAGVHISFDRESYDNKISERYHSNKTLGGEVIVDKIDLTKKFIEGEFNGIVEEVKSKKQIKITKGKFSISSN